VESDLLLRKACFVLRVVYYFWHGNTFAQRPTLAFCYGTLVVDLFYFALRNELNCLVEVLINLSDYQNVLLHAFLLTFPTLLLPDKTKSLRSYLLTIYPQLFLFCFTQILQHPPLLFVCRDCTVSSLFTQKVFRFRFSLVFYLQKHRKPSQTDS